MASCSPEEREDSTLAIFQSNMSDSDAKPNINLDLETAFLPAWAQKSSNDNPYANTKEKQGIMIESTDVPGGGATTALRVIAEVIDPVDPNGLIDPKDLRTEEAMIVGHALQGIVIAEDLPGEAIGHLTPEGGSAGQVLETGRLFGRNALAKRGRKF